ncbi:hypothetical protein WMF18_06950 [Sorangium sp. So ce315]|uniref:hypothetical protein n=1 Tax=Sorangium sp. So ce315 TaxID=3133299 RepID=UPI003F6136D1
MGSWPVDVFISHVPEDERPLGRLEVAARVLGVTPPVASEQLRELARRRLVAWDDATGLGRMHDSARDHARARRARGRVTAP